MIYVYTYDTYLVNMTHFYIPMYTNTRYDRTMNAYAFSTKLGCWDLPKSIEMVGFQMRDFFITDKSQVPLLLVESWFFTFILMIPPLLSICFLVKFQFHECCPCEHLNISTSYHQSHVFHFLVKFPTFSCPLFSVKSMACCAVLSNSSLGSGPANGRMASEVGFGGDGMTIKHARKDVGAYVYEIL